MRRMIAYVAGLLMVAPACAAERTLSVTDFDRLRVSGPMTVIVSDSRITSVRVSGDSHDLETVRVDVQNRTLTISVAHFGWGTSDKARGPVTLFVTTPHLRTAQLSGSGRVEIAHMRDPRVEIGAFGAGAVDVTKIEAESLALTMSGSGHLSASGRAAQAKLTAQGSGVIDADALKIEDLKALAQGAASINAVASRSALVEATGSASIKVGGHPACTVHNVGAGSVTCGKSPNGL